MIHNKRKRASRASIEESASDLHHFSLFPFLSNPDLCNLAGTSQEMRREYCSAPAQTTASRQLLTHVVRGEEERALGMIDVNPGLLLCASNATDYSGRAYNNYTPFQAALLCHDVTLWKKMEPFFDRLPNGREEQVRQFNAIFPEGIPYQRPFNFSALAETITDSSVADIDAALQRTQNDSEICKALDYFRSDFTALAMQEAFFNPLHFIEAIWVYRDQFKSWSWEQRHLFWRQVIGYTERFLPSCFAQALVQGLCHIVEEQEPLVRALMFKYETSSYFPLADSSGLGFEFAVYGSGGSAGPWENASLVDLPLLITYVKQNAKELLELKQGMLHSEPITDNNPNSANKL